MYENTCEKKNSGESDWIIVISGVILLSYFSRNSFYNKRLNDIIRNNISEVAILSENIFIEALTSSLVGNWLLQGIRRLHIMWNMTLVDQLDEQILFKQKFKPLGTFLGQSPINEFICWMRASKVEVSCVFLDQNHLWSYWNVT